MHSQSYDMNIWFQLITNGWDAQPVVTSGWDAQSALPHEYIYTWIKLITNGWDAWLD